MTLARGVLALMLSFVGVAAPPAQSVREVSTTDRSVVSVTTQVRFTTTLVLPADEEILDVVCGDKDYWVVSSAAHLAYVKPAREKAATNLALVTASGRIYTFLLREASDPPDLMVYVTREDASADVSTGSSKVKRFYRAEEMAALRQELDAWTARESDRAAQARREIDETIARIRSEFPTTLRFPYFWKRDGAPFLVDAIFHDGTTTYVRTRTTELPVLYEVRDNQASLVPFEVRDGLYVIPKVVREGYLALGKKRVPFVARPEGR